MNLIHEIANDLKKEKLFDKITSKLAQLLLEMPEIDNYDSKKEAV